MSRETLCFSMYSDMSIWIRASESPNMNSARLLASRVFPTPVGPARMKQPIGRFGSFRPARLEVLVGARLFLVLVEPLDLLVELLEVGGPGHRLEPDAGARLVDDVDGL